MLLPPLLGSLIWLILPESVKELITGLIGMGMMMLVVWLMTSLLKPLTAPERPKRLEART
jgi:Na+/phosphate symporter